MKFILNGADANLDVGYGAGGIVTVPSGVGWVAVSSQGAAYVTGGSDVSVISPDGSTVTTFATGLSNPTGIAIHANPVPEAPTSLVMVVVVIAGGLWVRRRSA